MFEHKSGAVNVQHFINENPFSGFQWVIFLICFLVALLDGFDTAAIGYVAPSLVAEWGIKKSDLAPVLSAALFGLAVGAISFGPVADRIGRKTVLILAVAVFAFGSLGAAVSDSLGHLELLRFLTGVGLGAAMPNAVTLLSEYCPEKRRFFLVNTMFCGFPAGAALGGFLAAWMIPAFGWRSVFVVGGIAPAILVVVMLFVLPESVRYLVAKNRPGSQVKKILGKISAGAEQAASFFLAENQAESHSKKNGVAVVLSRHYLLGSVMLWIAYFMGLVIFYGVMNWMPLLFKEANIPKELGSIVTGLFALGGLGAIVNGWLMDRFNPTKLIIGFALLTALLVALIGIAINIGIALLVMVVIAAGIAMNTAQTSLPSLAAGFYPTSGRTTGVSWMLGIGRFGGIAGSFLVAQLLAWQLSLQGIFFVLAAPALITVLALSIKYAYYNEPSAAQTAVA